MISIAGYEITSKIYESAYSIVYRGFRERDRLPVVFKIPREAFPSPAEIARYRKEYEIVRLLENVKGVIRAYALEPYENTLALCLEDFGGQTLKKLLQTRCHTIVEVLELAIRIAGILGRIHAANVVHKDINPSNILCHPDSGEIKTIDFRLSVVLARDRTEVRDPNLLEGTLAYISPEQTGRTNAPVDYRTDFYSLGATLYQMLTGHVPFPTTDAIELVHCHIAKKPVLPHRLNPHIPPFLSEIVMRMMEKIPEERYQSAWGIEADLKTCLQQLRETETIAPFVLGRYDVSDRFQVSQKLYGRDREKAALVSCFERATGRSSYAAELAIVSGYSGIGKSTLVREAYHAIASRGYFVSGKFDTLQQNVPYSALVAAFAELVRQLLGESQEALQRWKEKILDALGANARVAIELLPELERIVGDCPPAPEVGASEAQNRTHMVFQKLIRVFATEEHPLVIFLDDLQWADAATLKLVEAMLGGRQELADDRNGALHLLPIGACRDNEIDASHPLRATIARLEQQGVPVKRIRLEPLREEETAELVADTLHQSVEEVRPLAEAVLEKTQGNPFFTNEFLKSLHAEGCIFFDFDRLGWQWDLGAIESQDITDNVVDFMVDKLKKLPPATQQTLHIAACIGNSFDLHLLSLVWGRSEAETFPDLMPAVREGLLVSVSEFSNTEEKRDEFSRVLLHLRFLHDRVRQAAYTSIGETERPAVHLRVGRIFLACGTEVDRSERIFDIVNQLNFAIDILTEREERLELAALNQQAGRKAKATAAYETAARYLTVGLQLLPADGWQTCYELARSLHQEAAEAEYLATHFSRALKLVERVLDRVTEPLDRSQAYTVAIQVRIAQGRQIEAIEIGNQALAAFGISLGDGAANVEAIALPSVRDLAAAQPMTDPHKLEALHLLAIVGLPAYHTRPDLFPTVASLPVRLCAKFGYSPRAAFAYGVYGLFAYSRTGDLELAYDAGQIALRLLARYRADDLKAKIYMLFGAFACACKKHGRATLAWLQEGGQSGVETGDIEHASYCLMAYCSHVFLVGEPLATASENYQKHIGLLGKLKQQHCLHYAKIWQQVALNLQGKAIDPHVLVGDEFDETEMLPRFQRSCNYQSLFATYLARLLLCYLFRKYDRAVEFASRAREHRKSAFGVLLAAAHAFYESLALLATYPSASPDERERLWQQVGQNREMLRSWASHAPYNYQHKYDLVEAECAALRGEQLAAMEFYDKAIAGARAQAYMQEEAIAYERAALFHLGYGREEIARAYMTKAHYGYICWGATAKAVDLEETYPESIAYSAYQDRAMLPEEAIGTPTTGSNSSSSLDFATVMKASQAIVGEIVLDKLLQKLMKILIENAGAERGFLVFEERGRLAIEAAGTLEDESVKLVRSDAIENTLPVSIVRYAARTCESLVFNDVALDLQNPDAQLPNRQDPYILQNRPKSILCVPLIHQGKLTGVVYLENNVTAGAFTPNRIEIVKLLSAQAAASIDMAKLYGDLRASESQLTQFLEAMPVGVGVLDSLGGLHYFNQKAKEIFGKGILSNAQPDRLASLLRFYVAESDREYPAANLPMQRALKGEAASADDLEIRNGGRTTPIEIWSTPIYDPQGNIAYAIGAFQDITERKKAEARIKEYNQQLLQLNAAYERFVPQEFLKLLNKDSIVDARLGESVQKEMSILFSDIRSFTTLSERMGPEDNFKFINAFLSRMEPLIAENNGFIDKYIGDGIMALFGGSADDAVRAGISMLKKLAEYNLTRQRPDRPPISIGIGINTGPLMLGTVGATNRMQGTVIGDAVNLSARLEELTKEYGVSLLISHYTLARMSNPTQHNIRLLDRVKVKGKMKEVVVFEIFDGDDPEIRQAKLATVSWFEEGLLLYYRQQFAEAAAHFRTCLQHFPKDKAAQIYLQRCEAKQD